MYNPTEIRLKALYQAYPSIPAMLETYEELLLKREDIASIAHAGRLKLYRENIIDKKNLLELRKTFNEIYTLIDKNFPSIHFLIEGRRKSFISTDTKIVKNLNEHKSLDLIRDTNAFRIIIFGSSHEYISSCYSIMNYIIEFCIKAGFTPCDADKISKNPSIKQVHPEILIPESSGIDKAFLYAVKDYILNPKANGYQSIHSTFRSPKDGECFEVQIRTFDMHVHAESGSANHDDYKTKKYASSSSEFDRSKIHIPGYGISSDGQIFDFIGLEKALGILKRQKTF